MGNWGVGAHLEKLTTLVQIKGSAARLFSVTERRHYLIGDESVAALEKTSRKKKGTQLNLFEEPEVTIELSQSDNSLPVTGRTVLDRLHQSMLMFADGRSDAIKRFLVEEGIGRDPRFWRLAQALSALYPAGSDEKRWVDGLQARKKGLGF